MADDPISFAFHGVREFEAAVARIEAQASAATRSAVVEGAHVAQAAMQRRAGEGGRHARGTPTPATRGSGPAVISGNLRRSIVVAGPVPSGLGWVARIGPTMVYSRRIEIEYDYPYARPGFRDTLPLLPAIFRRHWTAALHAA